MKNMKSIFASSSFTVIGFMLAVTPVAAQEIEERDPDVIIVTAQKRTQTLAEVPQSISVLGGEALEAQQATSFVDYAALVPGLSIDQTDPGKSRIILRGINTGGDSPTAAVYVDDSPFGPSTGQSNGAVLAGDIDTFDIERVEVLRGPQGTFYGANSLGGLVKFVTTPPQLDKFSGKARAGLEFTDGGDMGYNGNAVINVPLGSTLAVRASGYYRKVGGYIDTVGINRENANDYQSYGGRASLLFKPSDQFSVRLMALAQNIRANSRATFDADPVTYEPLSYDPTITDPAIDNSTGGRWTRTEYFPESNNVDYRLYTGTVAWDFGLATLTSVTSYGTLDQKEVYDVTSTLPGVADSIYGGPGVGPLGITFPALANQEKFTQEVRLDSSSSDVVEWLIGAYYTEENGLLFQNYQPFELATGNGIDPSLTLPVGAGGADVTFPTFLTAILDSDYKEYAAFGSVTVHLGPRFDITAGGRYSHNKQNVLQSLDGSLLYFSGYPVEAIPDVVTGTSKENVFTWSVAPRLEISDFTTVYARIAKGYRPGGPNVVPPGAPADYPRQFGADTLVSYEAGVRAETPDRSFMIDASVYLLDWKNIQTLIAYETDIGIVNAAGNGESATSKGFEVSATVRPTTGFSVTTNFAYNDAQLDEDLGDDTGGFAGDRLPYAPELSANISADYEWALADDATAFVGGNVRFISDQYGNFDNPYQVFAEKRYTIDSYAVADIRAGVQFGRFGVMGFVRNLNNADGATSIGSFQVRPDQAVGVAPIRPRTAGLSISAEF